ncbi:hypothetical protein BaRGS_00005979 [Batillaria attramentaria]|uniref:Uncharacterized protein n=1 Tax=Batillaria attramentaria TaxID=370345 RepID=A0ABD0LT11_9CAEN
MKKAQENVKKHVSPVVTITEDTDARSTKQKIFLSEHKPTPGSYRRVYEPSVIAVTREAWEPAAAGNVSNMTYKFLCTGSVAGERCMQTVRGALHVPEGALSVHKA